MKIRIAICDDEPVQGNIVKNYLEKYFNKKSIEIENLCFFSGEEILAYKNIHQIDIFILDMQMKELNGLLTGEGLREKNRNAVLIYITAYKDYAIEAYEVDAFRYILKPIQYEKLEKTMDAAIIRLNKEALISRIEKNEKAFDDMFLIRNDDGDLAIKYEEIYYFEKDGRKVIINKKGDNISFGGSIKSLLNVLPPYFIKVHQGYVVNIKYIREVRGIEIHLKNGVTIKGSRDKIRELKRLMLREEW